MTEPLIEEQIAAALETVLPGQVWPVILPQNPSYPAVTYHRRDYEVHSDQWSLNPLPLRNAEGPRSLFQIVVYANPYTDCAYLLRDIKAALETVPGLQLDSVQDGYEFEQDVFCMITEWTVWGDLVSQTPNDPGQWQQVKPVVDAILADLSDHFAPRVATLRFHDPAERTLVTPALILDLDNLTQGEHPGDDRTPALCSFILHCLMPQQAVDAELKVRAMAAEVFARVEFNKWGLGPEVDFPDNLSAEQGTLSPGPKGYTHWTVSWEQTLYLVTQASIPEPPPPEEAFASFEPATGDTFEDEYESLAPTCEDSSEAGS